MSRARRASRVGRAGRVTCHRSPTLSTGHAPHEPPRKTTACHQRVQARILAFEREMIAREGPLNGKDGWREGEGLEKMSRFSLGSAAGSRKSGASVSSSRKSGASFGSAVSDYDYACSEADEAPVTAAYDEDAAMLAA